MSDTSCQVAALRADYVDGTIDSLPPGIWTPELQAERLERDVL